MTMTSSDAKRRDGDDRLSSDGIKVTRDEHNSRWEHMWETASGPTATMHALQHSTKLLT